MTWPQKRPLPPPPGHSGGSHSLPSATLPAPGRLDRFKFEVTRTLALSTSMIVDRTITETEFIVPTG